MTIRPPLSDTNSTSGLVPLGPIPSQAPVASFNLDQVESLLNTKGFVAYHYKSAFNPIRNTINAPAMPNLQAAHRNFLYYDPRPLRIVPQSFKIEDRLQIQGIYGVGSVLFNVTGSYLDDVETKSKTVYCNEHDLIVMPSLTARERQLVEYNPTGPMRLAHSVTGVEYLADEDREYYVNRDFKINADGTIEFIPGGLRPTMQSSGMNATPRVLTCAYYTTLIYVVTTMLHSLRVLPDNSTGQGGLPREARYAPQLLVAMPSTLIKENNIMDFGALPPFPAYAASHNTTGGSI